MSPEGATVALELCLDLLRLNAVRLAREGRYEEADAWVGEMLRARESADLHCLRGKIQAQRARISEAEASFRLALRLHPEHQDAARALARLVSLRGRSPRTVIVRRFVLTVTGMAMALALVSNEVSKHESPAIVAASTAPAAIGPPAKAATVDVDPALIDAYVAIEAGLEPLKARFMLRSRAVRTESGLAVAISGAVPTKQALEQIRSLATGSVGIDTRDLKTEPSYRVRPHDTLTSVAQAVYGDARGWPGIWESNREVLIEPGLIIPGQQLRIPTWP